MRAVHFKWTYFIHTKTVKKYLIIWRIINFKTMICWYFDFMYLTCVTAKIHLRSTVSLMNRAWPWRMSNLVKYCQALCLFWSLIFDLWKNGHRLTLKSLFTCHHHPPPTTRNLFLVSNERYGQNKTFLLRCYGIDFAPIKRYCPFCFYDCM